MGVSVSSQMPYKKPPPPHKRENFSSPDWKQKAINAGQFVTSTADCSLITSVSVFVQNTGMIKWRLAGTLYSSVTANPNTETGYFAFVLVPYNTGVVVCTTCINVSQMLQFPCTVFPYVFVWFSQ
jgi:hypothetical protein